ncbi:MAG: hypothetical protein Q8Q62_17475 [Mesorhizobium sp.]|nr:hypothetical protein [Mesorhizobium sp.]
MTDTNSAPNAPRQTDQWLEPGKTNVQVVYFLYIVGMFIGISALIGLVIAYINRGKVGGWVDTHYTWLIRTFWIGLLYGFVSILLMFLVIGFVTAIATAVWVIVRCVIGLQAVGRNEPIKNPESWII